MSKSGDKRKHMNSSNPVEHQVSGNDASGSVSAHEAQQIDASNSAHDPISSSSGPRSKFLKLMEPVAASDPPVQKHAVVASGGNPSPPSPSGNRQKFLNGLLPTRICCNLDLCRAPSGSKFNISGICVSVFPAQSNPDRRYIQLADETGTVGITVWNGNVAKFDSSTAGQLVTCSKVAMSSHNGKKMLTMTRESSIQIVNDDQHLVSRWWISLLHEKPKSCSAVHDAAEGSMISVTGILGFVNSEVKMVNGVEKHLTYLHLVDSTGRLDVRSWNHSVDLFMPLRDRPVCISRTRVTSFAGTKVCELLDGDASVFATEFPGQAELLEFWQS